MTGPIPKDRRAEQKRSIGKVLMERRIEYIRMLLTRGLRQISILDLCEVHPLFETDAKPENRHPMSRTAILKIMYETQRRMREETFDGSYETRLAYDRCVLAYRKGYEVDDPRAMYLAQKELNRMLGLKVESQNAGTEAETVMDQLRQMQQATTVTESISAPASTAQKAQRSESTQRSKPAPVQLAKKPRGKEPAKGSRGKGKNRNSKTRRKV